MPENQNQHEEHTPIEIELEEESRYRPGAFSWLTPGLAITLLIVFASIIGSWAKNEANSSFVAGQNAELKEQTSKLAVQVLELQLANQKHADINERQDRDIASMNASQNETNKVLQAMKSDLSTLLERTKNLK